MDTITKESPEWLAALALVPKKFTPGKCERCHILEFTRAETLPSGNIAVHHVQHDIPIPDITPDLIYAILEAGFQRNDDEFLTTVATEYEIGLQSSVYSVADAIIRVAAGLGASLAVERD